MTMTKGKFNSLKDEVVYRATLDGCAETMGDTDIGHHYSKMVDFYGLDYIVIEDGQGFVTVESFEHIDIDADGYYCPVERRWDTYASIVDTSIEEES